MTIVIGDTVTARLYNGKFIPQEFTVLALETSRLRHAAPMSVAGVTSTQVTNNEVLFFLDNGQWVESHQIDLP